MDLSSISQIIETIILIYALGTIITVLLFWLIISSAVKHGVKKALEEVLHNGLYIEDEDEVISIEDEVKEELSNW